MYNIFREENEEENNIDDEIDQERINNSLLFVEMYKNGKRLYFDLSQFRNYDALNPF